MRLLIMIFMILFSLPALAKEYIVFHKDGVVDAQDNRAKRHLKNFKASVLELTDKEAAALKAKGIRIEENKKVHIMGHKSVSALGIHIIPWGVTAIKADAAQALGFSGQGITVCVVDTGVDDSHPDLAGQISGGENFVAGGPTDQAKPVYFDDNDHGTHVNGTIVGLGIPDGVLGVAPKAKVYAVKVLDASGSGDYSAVADGLKACIGHAQIVNMSLGGPEDSQTIHDAVSAVLQAGMIVMVAAGNESGPIGYPAAYVGVHAISAVDQKMGFASFSDFGPQMAYAAPGVGITSTIPGGKYDTWDGTSMATPHASGVAALMLSAHKSIIKTTRIQSLTSDQQGKGLLDANCTVQ